MTYLRESAAWVKQPIVLEPRMVERVWGGSRFPAGALPVGEAWLVHESNRIVGGPAAGCTLAEAVAEAGEALLGSALWSTGERRFPLLIKLLDTREWLSIQVHPDDALATELEGPGLRGKTEAWFTIDASPDAEIIAGVQTGVTPETLAIAMRDGTIETIVSRYPMRPNDVLAIEAGTVHALGPGLFMYEIQQSSDITYRVSDWNRPASAGRKLHIEQSIRASDPSRRPHPEPVPEPADGEITTIVSLDPFTLEIAALDSRSIELIQAGERFAILTVIEGATSLVFAGPELSLKPFDTVILPAALARCTLRAAGPSRVLIARSA